MTTGLIIVIILQAAIVLLVAYLSNYANQKGKNLADKEDLKKLTEIVETVKKKNIEEIELLKANLSILTDKKSQLFSEEKEAIIIFFSQLHKWIWDSLNIYLNEYNHTNYKDLSDRLIIMRDAYNQTNVSFAKVQLLVKDNDLINLGHEAIVETLKLHHFKENLIQRLSWTLSGEKILVDQIISGKMDLKSSGLSDFYMTQAKDREAEKKAVWDEYLAKHKDTFATAIIKANNFKDKAKIYLND